MRHTDNSAQDVSFSFSTFEMYIWLCVKSFPKYGKPSTKHLMWLTFSTFELSGGFAAQYDARYVPRV